jgi:hypothetical protein
MPSSSATLRFDGRAQSPCTSVHGERSCSNIPNTHHSTQRLLWIFCNAIAAIAGPYAPFPLVVITSSHTHIPAPPHAHPPFIRTSPPKPSSSHALHRPPQIDNRASDAFLSDLRFPPTEGKRVPSSARATPRRTPHCTAPASTPHCAPHRTPLRTAPRAASPHSRAGPPAQRVPRGTGARRRLGESASRRRRQIARACECAEPGPSRGPKSGPDSKGCCEGRAVKGRGEGVVLCCSRGVSSAEEEDRMERDSE